LYFLRDTTIDNVKPDVLNQFVIRIIRDDNLPLDIPTNKKRTNLLSQHHYMRL
jgi:hypothetical protein